MHFVEVVKSPELVEQLATICLPVYEPWNSPSPERNDTRSSMTLTPLIEIFTLVKDERDNVWAKSANRGPGAFFCRCSGRIGRTVPDSKNKTQLTRRVNFFFNSVDKDTLDGVRVNLS